MIAVAALLGLTLLVLTVFNAAVHALPVCIGVLAGMFALHSGSGEFGAVLVGLLSGAFVAGIARQLANSGPLGPPVALVFAGVSGIAG